MEETVCWVVLFSFASSFRPTGVVSITILFAGLSPIHSKCCWCCWCCFFLHPRSFSLHSLSRERGLSLFILSGLYCFFLFFFLLFSYSLSVAEYYCIRFFYLKQN